ncbi:MAG TPA: NHL repeat-containing protein, partial [Acidimicrobiales bacterium]|nr:NHL repeat-containing protein [Acidimicrobiales bacterium]
MAIALMVAAAALPAPAGAQVAWSAPVAERIMAGPSRAAVAPWGLAYNPVNGELVVGDYLANRLRRYSVDGTYLGDFVDPTATAGGVPLGVAVDPRDGAVYVAMTGDQPRTTKDIRKYRPDGTFMYDFDVPDGVTWLAVRNDGVLVVPEAFGESIRLVTVNDAARSATAGPPFGPATGRLTAADVAADGTMYVAHPTSGVVHVYAPDGHELRTIGSRAVLPGDMRGVLLDEARGRLYVADAGTGEIDVFSLDGSHIGQIGSGGTAPGQFPDGARQLELLPDGSVLAADYGGRRVQRFSPDGQLLAVFPHPSQDAGRQGFVEPRGVVLDPATRDVLVADPWAQRVQRFAADGTLLAVHGVRGSFPPDGMNYPRSVAVDPASGEVWVPNYEGAPFIVVYDREFHHLRTVTTPRFVNDIEIVGGLAYLVVRRPGEVRVVDVATGALVRTFPLPAEGRGVAVDPATGELWITADLSRDLWVFGPTGDRRRTLQVDNRGWGVTMVGDTVYVADAAANDIIAYDRGSKARLGVFGSSGKGLGQLGGPSGIIAGPDGRLYVVEQRNARLQVFGPGPVPPADGAPPTVTWTGPPNNSTSSGWPLVVGGRVADPAGVAQVQVAVTDMATGRLWDGINTRWGAFVWNPAVVSGSIEDGS